MLRCYNSSQKCHVKIQEGICALIQDELQPNYEYDEKQVDGVRVRLHHWLETKKDNEDWYVEIENGGAIPTEHFGSSKTNAKIHYDSINHGIVATQKEIFSMQKKIGELRLKVHDRLSTAVFEQRPLREDEV